jgi:hypothetical protein
MVRELLGEDGRRTLVKKTNNKRLALEQERVKNLVVVLSPAELRRINAAGQSTDRTTTTTQEFPPSARMC